MKCPNCEIETDNSICNNCFFPLNEMDKHIEKYQENNISSFSTYFFIIYYLIKSAYILFLVSSISLLVICLFLYFFNNNQIVGLVLFIIAIIFSIIPFILNIIISFIFRNKDKKLINKNNLKIFFFQDKIIVYEENKFKILNYSDLKKVIKLKGHYGLYFNKYQNRHTIIVLLIDIEKISIKTKKIIRGI